MANLLKVYIKNDGVKNLIQIQRDYNEYVFNDGVTDGTARQIEIHEGKLEEVSAIPWPLDELTNMGYREITKQDALSLLIEPDIDAKDFDAYGTITDYFEEDYIDIYFPRGVDFSN